MVKRIKTIGLTLAGLLAMLGSEAEAHYMYAGGRWIYHSVGCEVTIGDLPPSPDPVVVGCLVATAQVETLCPGPSIVSLSVQVSLAAQALIAPGQTQVEVLVSDSPLLNLGACGSVAPVAVLIRNMASTVTVSKCVGLGCLVQLVTSTAAATCALPTQFNLVNYPANLPPDGTPFTCTAPLIVHVN